MSEGKIEHLKFVFFLF